MVGGIVNLTKREMWVYGTSGELIKLEPVKLRKDGRLPFPEDERYYAIDVRDNASRILEENPEYCGRIVIPKYLGVGIHKEKIYSFTTPSGMNVLPITDGTGRNGTVVVKEDGRTKCTKTVYIAV